MLTTEDIRVRDPYIVAHEGKYYLYSSTVINDKMSDRAVYVYVSRDCRQLCGFCGRLQKRQHSREMGAS